MCARPLTIMSAASGECKALLPRAREISKETLAPLTPQEATLFLQLLEKLARE